MAASLVGAVAVQPAPAEAQPRWGRYQGDGYTPHGLRQRYYASRYYGGAVAAGVIGGPALGAIASAASNPYYGPGYCRPAYYAPPRCVFERRRVVNAYGRVVVRRIRTCY